MLGLHPYNASRWNAKSWCDTLISFAESNNLLLVCPDGGLDGKIDDPIDLAFTDALLDSVQQWYTIDTTKIFCMGFSWGGRATYRYGLSRASTFAGLFPIGAAISGTQELDSLLSAAQDMPVYVLHGANDLPNTRFYPAIDSLLAHGACLESNLLAGVGHTIDFPARNTLLTDSFMWLNAVSCGTPTSNISDAFFNDGHFSTYPNPLQSGDSFYIKLGDKLATSGTLRIYNLSGTLLVEQSYTHNHITVNTAQKGVYFVGIAHKSQWIIEKVVVY